MKEKRKKEPRKIHTPPTHWNAEDVKFHDIVCFAYAYFIKIGMPTRSIKYPIEIRILPFGSDDWIWSIVCIDISCTYPAALISCVLHVKCRIAYILSFSKRKWTDQEYILEFLSVIKCKNFSFSLRHLWHEFSIKIVLHNHASIVSSYNFDIWIVKLILLIMHTNKQKKKKTSQYICSEKKSKNKTSIL